MTAPRPDWDLAYQEKAAEALSWHEAAPEVSLNLIARTGLPKESAIIDVGAGASPVLLALAGMGYTDLTALDLSVTALANLRTRMTAQSRLQTIRADICDWQPDRQYDLWHDRAALHFLTDAQDRAKYAATLSAALRPGGFGVIGTFAPDGPTHCFGQPVHQYDATSLMAVLGQGFTLTEDRRHTHVTPAGTKQRYFYALVRRTP